MSRLFRTLLGDRQSSSAATRARFNQLRPFRVHMVLVALATTTFLFAAIWISTPVHATSFTSTQSGSWGNSSTWGGGGIPSASDDVTIASGTTVTLDANRASSNLTIQAGGTLNLAGSVFQLNNNSTFVNLGNVTNSGISSAFIFTGNGTAGGIVQTLGGAGGYSSNVLLELSGQVTVTTNSTTAISGAVNIQIDPLSTLQLVNGLRITGPQAPSPTFANVINNGTIIGNPLKTQGNVRFTGSGSFGVTLEVESGTTQGNTGFTFTSGTAFQIDNGATFDLAGQTFSLQGNNITFNNLGTVSNSGGSAAFVFTGNGTVGGIVQTLGGAGGYSSNVLLELAGKVTLATNSTTAISGAVNIQIDPLSTLQLVNGLRITGPQAPSTTFANVTNNGTIIGNPLRTQGNVQFTGNGTYGVTLEVESGTTRGSTGLNFTSGTAFQIDNGATFDLAGQSFSFQGNDIAFNNLGTVSNSGGTAAFVLTGNGTAGGIVQTLGGVGGYSSNVLLELSGQVTVTTNSTTAISGAVNIQIDPLSTLQLVNGLRITGPQAPSPTFANVINNGTIIGNPLKTQGNVRFTGSGSFGVTLEVEAGTTQGNTGFTFTSGTAFQIDNGATFDLAGQTFSLQGNNITFNNLGTVSNSGGSAAFVFTGNGTAGGIVQTLGGAGGYSSNVLLELAGKVTLATNSTTAISGAVNIQIDPLSTLQLVNGLRITGPQAPAPTFANVTNNGTIIGNALMTQGNVQFTGNGTYGVTLEVESGTTRGSNFNLVGGAALVIDNGGTLTGANSITGNVTNSGTLGFGTTPACLNITGNYAQAGTGILDFKIGGPGACSQFDRLAIGGAATLAGTIKGTLVNFTPGNNDSFQVMSFASRTGTFSVVTGSFTANYTATTASLISQTGNFTISGRVLDESGAAVAGVAVNLTGASSATANTDSSGNYSFSNLLSGNYTVSAFAAGESFSPASFNFSNLNGDRIANFVAKQTLAAINGNIVDANDAVMNNVGMSLLKNGIPAGTTQTNVVGNYSFANLEAGANYVVTPNGSFSPSSQNFNNLSTNVTANFKAAPDIPPQCNTVNFTRFDTVVGTTPITVAAADFNADGNLDLVSTNRGSNNISILLGTGAGAFNVSSIQVGTAPYGVAVLDANRDGKNDLAVTNSSSDNVSVLLGTGTGSFSAPVNFNVGTTPEFVTSGDFNNDGNPDLIVVNANSNNLSILLGTGTGTFSAPNNISMSAYAVAIADFNQDGNSDLAVARRGSNNISILLGNGAGSFNAGTDFAVASDPLAITASDFNSDGRIDLAAVVGNNVSILLGNGSGAFGAAANFPVGISPRSVAVGDINRDGKTDLVVSNFLSNVVSVLLGKGTGSFSPTMNTLVGNGPMSAVIGDFNNDAKPDVVSGNSTLNSVSLLQNSAAVCNAQGSLSISGRVANATNSALPDVVVTLSGPITRVTQTDASGNYSFGNLIPGGNYIVTVQSSYFVFAPSRADFFNFSSGQVANFIAAPLAVPSPTPTPNDDFGNTARDASKWSIGAQTSATTAFDPQVTTTQTNGQLIVAPLTQATGLHYAGYVSANSFDLRNGSAKVELVKAGAGGADSIFAIGTDVDNFYRFMVHTPGPGTTLASRARGRDGIERPLDTTTAQLVFQVSVNGQITSLSINYDPVQHRFMRFRHVPPQNSIVFETSPDNIDFTIQHTVVLQKSVSALTAELSAGTSNPANPGATVFDNFGLVTSTFQFSAASYSVGEGDGSILVTVTRGGSLTDPATVDFATADGTARQKTKYTNSAGTLSFAAGISSRTFRVLLVDNQLAEGDQSLNLLLSNPTGAGLNTPGRAVLTISDNDTTLATGNPMDDARYFTTQHYYDFLNRVPDQSGLDFWTGQITQCGTDIQCLRTQRITVSNAFFYEQEYQQTGSYVVRLYRAAFGNNQPISNNDNNPNFPNENKKLVNYSVFSTDRARVRGGPSLAQTQLDLANAFVLRSQFLARYPSSLAGPAYVDALLTGINTDTGVDLSSQRTALIDLFNSGGRGVVLYRLVDDNTQTNPINNRAFIDAEYNRSFVLTQYFGYLRRNPDIGGFIFWLGQVNSAPLRALEKQRAMVCSFITSTEYQQRFSPVATHNNIECQ